jgi:predicted DNA-binding protein
MAQPKIRLPLDLTLEESQRLESICKSLGITKIEFLRKAIAQAEKEGR